MLVVLGHDHAHVPAGFQLAEQHLVGERLLDVLLDHARHRPRAHLLVVAVVDQPLRGVVRQLDGDVAVGELRLELEHELLHHQRDHLAGEVREGDDRVEPVAEFRREHAVDRLDVVALALGAREAVGRLGQIGGARVGGHDQDHVAEVDLLAVVVGELAVIHDLQEHVEQVGMRLLDLVEQEHAVRMLVDAVGEQAALVEADIAGRRADQPRDRVALHVFRHVEADDLDAERGGELARDLGLADAGRPGEQVAADRLLDLAQAGAGELDGGGERADRLVLAVDHALEGLLEMLQHLGIVLRHGLRRDARHGGDRGFDLLDADRLLAAVLRQQHLRRARLVDHVDRLVGQLAVVDVARGKLHRRLDRLVGVFQPVVILEIGLEPLHDFDRVGDARLVDVDLLEPAHQRAVLSRNTGGIPCRWSSPCSARCRRRARA